MLLFDQLHAALDKCMKAHPPNGVELALHADANKMADLWGPMFLERTPSVPLESVKPSVLEAYRRWSDL